MKWFSLILFVSLISCNDGLDEKAVALRLDRNNELLQKQVNLLKRSIILRGAKNTNNPARSLYEESENWLNELENKLEKYQTASQSEELFLRFVHRFNDSMRLYSGLLIDWKPDKLESDENELLRSWKQNNYLLLEIEVIEKCLELYEVKSNSASESLMPIVYSSQFYQVQKGKNAIFDVAFKSKKPELVEIKINRALLNGKRINLKNIEIDRYTQRFILFSLDKGDYTIEGDLILVNERGEKDAYPFRQDFRVD